MSSGVRDTIQHVLLIHGRIRSLTVTLQESLAVATSLAGSDGSKIDASEFRELVRLLEEAQVPGRELFCGKAKAKKRSNVDWFFEVWDEISDRHGHRVVLQQDDVTRSIKTFMSRGLNATDLEELIEVAMGRPVCDDRWRYFCGCAWRTIKEM